MLDVASVKYSIHMMVGKPWEVISDYAAKNGFDLVLMGTRGLGTYTGAALGSVAQGVAQRSTFPCCSSNERRRDKTSVPQRGVAKAAR